MFLLKMLLIHLLPIAAVPARATNIRATAQKGDDGQAVPDDDYVGSAPANVRVQAATGTADDPIQMNGIGDDVNVSFEDAFDTPFTDSLPSYARGVGRMGAALRGYARSGGYSGSATSDNIGDAINQARGGAPPPQPEAPSGRPKFTTAEDDEFGDAPFGEEFGLRGDVRPLGQTEIGGRGPQALQLEEKTPLQETEPATVGDAQPELPKITVQDVDPPTAPDTSGITQEAETAEEEATGAVEDLAPELTQAASAGS